MIHFGDQSGQFFSLRADGSTNWVLDIGPGAVDSSPVIADDGTIFVGCGSRLVAIAGQGGPAPSAWPMYRRDARHTAQLVNLSMDRPVLTANRRGGGTMEVSLVGQENRAYTLLGSSNLQHWLAYTNVLGPTNKHVFEVETSRDQRFFRGLAH